MVSVNNATPEQATILSRELAQQRSDEAALRAYKNIQLARLYLNLETVRARIQNEILPAAAYLEMPDEELLQTLDLAADTIQRYLSTFKPYERKVGNMTKFEKEIADLRTDYPTIRFNPSSDPQTEDHEVSLDDLRHVQVSLNFRRFTPCIQDGQSFIYGRAQRSLKNAVEQMPRV